ncbi:MAG: potassium channel family protein, partial [Planctomycetota bacterium]
EAAAVDGATLIWDCGFDHRTNFKGVGLHSARVEPETKQLLEYNIRRMNWEQWYKKHPLLRSPVRAFWHLSNYGLSTWRVIIWFFVLSFVFAAVYSNLAYWFPPGVVNDLYTMPEPSGQASRLDLIDYGLEVLFRPIYFSVVTMTTLGFGDMYARPGSWLGHVLLMLQVILGYVLLGALVTRFAVLFTAGGPAGEFAEGKTKGEKQTQDRGNRYLE